MESRMDSIRYLIIPFGVVFNFLVGGIALGIDQYFKKTLTKSFLIHVGGTFALGISAVLFLLFFFLKVTGIKSRSFYVLIFPLLITSSINSFAIVELWHIPNSLLLPNLVTPADAVHGSVWAHSYVYIDGTILHGLSFISLFNYYNGLPWRSLILYYAVVIFVMTIDLIFVLTTMKLPLSIFTKCFYFAIPFCLLLPIGVWLQPRDYSFARNQFNKRYLSGMEVITMILMILSIIIYVAKYLLSTGLTLAILEPFESTDPMILFEGIDGAIPPGVVHAWFGFVIVVPTLIVAVGYMLFGKKEEFLWDLGVIQAAIIFMCQAYSIIGSLHWNIPFGVRVDWNEILFWIINLIPLLASLLYLNYLARDKIDDLSLVSMTKRKSR